MLLARFRVRLLEIQAGENTRLAAVACPHRHRRSRAVFRQTCSLLVLSVPSLARFSLIFGIEMTAGIITQFLGSGLRKGVTAQKPVGEEEFCQACRESVDPTVTRYRERSYRMSIFPMEPSMHREP